MLINSESYHHCLTVYKPHISNHRKLHRISEVKRINQMTIIMKTLWLAAFTGAAALISCAQNNSQNFKMNTTKASEKTEATLTGKADTATFGTGCFWCTEA